METITIEPRSRRQLGVLEGLFREMGVPVRKPQPETLEAKAFRLYAEGHYSEEDLRDFLSIPKEHRADPFDISPSGDVYWADLRNVEDLRRNSGRTEKDMAEEKLMTLGRGESIEDFMQKLLTDEPV